jgi:toxin CptA
MTDSIPPLLVLRLKSSYRLALMLSLAHVSATALLWPLTLPLVVKLAATAAMGLSLAIYLRHYALRNSPGSITSLALAADMTCTLETRRGQRLTCTLLGSSFVAPYLTVLELKPLETTRWWHRLHAHSVVILPDTVDSEEFRRLRVLLRWKWKEQN